MYNFPSNSPEDSCWLQATAQRYHARRLDDGPDRRSWPYGQVLGPDSSSQPRSAHSLHHHTVATAQPDHAHWPSFSLRPRPEGYLSSSTDSCQSVNFASCQPTVLSPIRATNFQSYACSPQWQSPNQYRTFPVSAQCSASVHNESVHNVIPNPFQGSLHSVQNHDHPRADFFAADLLSKDGLSMTNFTAVQSPDTGSLSSMSVGRMHDFTTTKSCAFPVATQPFILLDRGGHAQIAADSDERCSSLSTHSSAPQTNSKSELPEEDLISYIPLVKKADVALEVDRPTKRISDAADISSQEIVRSNSDGQCGCPHVPKSSGRKRTKIDHITVAYLEEHKCFDMPLAEAARSLDVGLSVMKRVCRTLGLARWPYRTRASLQNVIEKTQIYLDDNADTEDGEALSGQKADVIEALQSQMSSVTGQGSSDLKTAIKKYRQSIFKLNYKLKKNRSSPSARHKITVPRNAAERILADQSE